MRRLPTKNIAKIFIRPLLGLVSVIFILSANNSFAQNYQYSIDRNNFDIPEGGFLMQTNIDITGAPAGAIVTGVDVYFKCVHTYSGDLLISFGHYDSLQEYILWDREGGSADNPTRTVNGITTYNGLPVNSLWYLLLSDMEPLDTGYLDEWSIKVYYETTTAKNFNWNLFLPAITGTYKPPLPPPPPPPSAWNKLQGTWSRCDHTPGNNISMKMKFQYSVNYGSDKNEYPYHEREFLGEGYGNTTCSGTPATTDEYELGTETFKIIPISENELKLDYNSTYLANENILIESGGKSMLKGTGTYFNPPLRYTKE